MSITLGGNVCVRNGDSLDYCWREAVESLLPICDEVVVCDGESTDGTQEYVRAWMLHEPKIKLCVYPWPEPNGVITFWTDWLNFAREHIKSDFQIQLDADEILHENSYPFLERFKLMQEPHYRTSLWCDRFNFWKDPQHLIPHGVCCSHRVVRVAPTSVWLPSDGPDERGAEAIGMAVYPMAIGIGHYGFLRKTAAFFAKARALQGYFFGTYDERLAAVERNQILNSKATTGNWMVDIKDVEWTSRLVPFHGTHPALALPWLKERGYNI